VFALIANSIRESFPEHPIIASSEAVEDTHSVEHLYERLVGRSYREPSIEDYRACVDGMSLLTTAGLAYYLPGYLLASIEDVEAADVIPGSIVSTFSIGRWPSFDGRTRAIFGSFTSRQKLAVALWLGFYTIHFGFDQDVHNCYRALQCGADLPKAHAFPDFAGYVCSQCKKTVS